MQAASTEGDGGRRPDRGDALVALLVAVALFGLFVAMQWAAIPSCPVSPKLARVSPKLAESGRLSHSIPSTSLARRQDVTKSRAT
jgi:hypothetical protein